MDLENLSSNDKSLEGVDMPIRHPNTGEPVTHEVEGKDEPQAMYLTLLGPDSPKFQRAARQINVRNSNRDENKELSNAEIEADRKSDSKMLAGLTVGGKVFLQGEWKDYSKDNSYALYFGVTHIRLEALKFAQKPGNYIGD